MTTQTLTNTIIVLFGFPGTGKYTIGRELSELTGAKLIHNHLINNPIFAVVDADGIKPLPAGIWSKVGQVRQVVYDSIRELSPAEASFIFTIHLTEAEPLDHDAFADLVQLAESRKSLFAPIRLLCDVDELCRRIETPERARMLKQLSAESARKRSLEHTVLKPAHPNLHTIDVTRLSPRASAEAVLAAIDSMRSQFNV